MEKMIEFVQNKIRTLNVNTSIDFTMGNGHDTKFLCQNSNYVYSFDIQPLALENTKALIKDYDNVQLILDSHEYFDNYVNSFDVGIFNLGYLPSGNHNITTNNITTINTIKKALPLLNKKGYLFIVVYVGHDEGKKESIVINEYVSLLDHKLYNVALFKMMNKDNSPYVIEIEKR